MSSPAQVLRRRYDRNNLRRRLARAAARPTAPCRQCPYAYCERRPCEAYP